jgi:hypothetical protein
MEASFTHGMKLPVVPYRNPYANPISTDHDSAHRSYLHIYLLVISVAARGAVLAPKDHRQSL